MFSLMDALATCIGIGDRGMLPAIALLNVALGGNTPVPELVQVLPPGYGRFLRRMAVVDEVTVGELLDDIPFRRARYTERAEDKDGKQVKIVHERYPMAFGVYIEYEHPKHGVSKLLLVVHDVGTGSYPYRAFIAPASVAEKVGSLVEQYRTVYLTDRSRITRDFKAVRDILKAHSYREVRDLEHRGEGLLPPGVRVEPVEVEERGRHRHHPF